MRQSEYTPVRADDDFLRHLAWNVVENFFYNYYKEGKLSSGLDFKYIDILLVTLPNDINVEEHANSYGT